jgi:hypothetical protein
MAIAFTAFLFSGCAFTLVIPTKEGNAVVELDALTGRQDTRFEDADGTLYDMRLRSTIAAKIDSSASKFGYDFKAEPNSENLTEGNITVGSEQAGLNHEAQTQIVESVVKGVVEGITKSAGIP